MTSSIRDSAESAGGSEEYGTGADAPVPEDTVEGMRDPHTHPLAAPLGRLPNGARIVIPVVVGTRPEAIKLVPVILALQASEYYQPLVVSTGELVLTLYQSVIPPALPLGSAELQVYEDGSLAPATL